MVNPFEQGIRRVIPAVLVYVRWRDDVLMIQKSRGLHGKAGASSIWNGLGGKCELDESFQEAARREVLEECGLDLDLKQFKSLGALQFPHFKAHKDEDWLVFVFYADLKAETRPATLSEVAEGTLHWVPAKTILDLPLWSGDQYFIPHVLNRIPFVGTFWYRNGELERHFIQTIEPSIVERVL